MKKAVSIVLIIATMLALLCSCKSTGKPIVSGDYEYVVLEDGTAKITKYLGTKDIPEFEIPSALDGYTVTVIGKESFKDVQCIRKVYTPDTIITIEEYAFAGSSIKNALMHKSSLLTDIGPYAFAECKNLIQADIPMNLVNLGDYAFYYCEKLKTAQFRGDPENIGEFIFDACPKVTIKFKSMAKGLQNYVDTYQLKFKIVDPTKK